jgi:anti-sigma B factor antagonist
MNFRVDLDARPDLTVVRPVGEIDLETAPSFKSALVEAIEAGAPLVIVDGSETTFLDSTGLGALVFAHKRLVSAGGWLVVANLRPPVARAILLTGLDAVIPTQVSESPTKPWDEEGATAKSVLGVICPQFKGAATK